MPTEKTVGIRPLHFPADEAAFYALRREGLEREPACFTVTPADDARRVGRFAGYQPGPERVIWGAFLANELVGIVRFERERLDKLRHKAHLHGLYVRAEATGQSLGRQLVRAVVDFARQQPDLEQLQLTVVASNDRARHLYLTEGFVSTGLAPRAFKWAGQYFDEEALILWLQAQPGGVGQ